MSPHARLFTILVLVYAVAVLVAYGLGWRP